MNQETCTLKKSPPPPPQQAMNMVSLTTTTSGTTITVASSYPPRKPLSPSLFHFHPLARQPPHSVLAFPQHRHYPSIRTSKSVSLSCRAVEGNSTSGSSATADADPPSQERTAEINDGGDSPSQDLSSEVKEQESLGKALREAREENIAAGKENPSKTEEFWQGVLEETRLIEWPSLQKVLSTTGVVVSIIVGSSLVLLTVNALLAELSDVIFKNTPPM